MGAMAPRRRTRWFATRFRSGRWTPSAAAGLALIRVTAETREKQQQLNNKRDSDETFLSFTGGGRRPLLSSHLRLGGLLGGDDALLANAADLSAGSIASAARSCSFSCAAIDVSDGLLADLGHLLKASGVGARLDAEALPLAEGLVEALGTEAAREAALTGGDDYELVVALPSAAFDRARLALAELGLAFVAIGQVTASPGIQGVNASSLPGWQHFHGGTS